MMTFLRAIGFLFDLILAPLRLGMRGRGLPPDAWLTLTIDGRVVDLVAPPRFWERRKQRSVSLHRLDAVVTAMLTDDRVKGILVTIKSLKAGMATASSLRAILGRARAGGKEVVVHLPLGGDTKEVHVASIATRLYLGPSSQLAPLGFRSTARYLKTVLDKAGIEPQVFACGEFKSAGETLVRDAMSPAQRAQTERLLEEFHGAVVDGIAQGRKISRERAAAILDEGPYFGRAAVTAGLADGVAYEDEMPKMLALPKEGKLVSASAYLVRVTRPLLRRVRRRARIAVVPIHGTITHVAGLFESASTDECVTRMIRAARRDPLVRGVILHIDSPGGSALASDLMHHEIEQLARDKPVVAFMANVAASGGYYVAAPAKRIVAHATTITGSIGVVAARLSLEPLLTKLGVTTEIVAKGARSELLAPMGPLSEDGKTTIARELDATYQAFVSVVAVGRAKPEAEVERLARGRVYTGRDAFDVGLVDVLGGFDAALAELRSLLEPGERDRVDVVLARTPRGPVASPRPDEAEEGGKRAARAVVRALVPSGELAIVDLALSGERVFALAPIHES